MFEFYFILYASRNSRISVEILSSAPGPTREVSLNVSGHTVRRRGFQWGGPAVPGRSCCLHWLQNTYGGLFWCFVVVGRAQLLLSHYCSDCKIYPRHPCTKCSKRARLLCWICYSGAEEPTKTINSGWCAFFSHSNLKHHAKHQIL